MKLITEEFEVLFNDYPLYSQEHEKNPLVITIRLSVINHMESLLHRKKTSSYSPANSLVLFLAGGYLAKFVHDMKKGQNGVR